jgi:hypothetical protein
LITKGISLLNNAGQKNPPKIPTMEEDVHHVYVWDEFKGTFPHIKGANC